MKKRLLVLLTTLTCASLFGTAIQPQPVLLSTSLENYRLMQTQFGPLDRLFIRDGICYVLVDQSLRQRTAAAGIPHSVHNLNHPPQSTAKTVSVGGINGAFHDSLEAETAMREMADRNPAVAGLIHLGQSVEGRNINALWISGAPPDRDVPIIYILGCHHAREWISVEVPLDFARHLLDRYDHDADLRHAVDNSRIYVIPVLNPDGLEYSIYRYRYWRKNRRYNGDFSWGVDLNRNYGYKWGIDNTGSSPNTRSATYRGVKAFSEPETQVLRDFMLRHPPAGVISYHNFSQIILYPWGYTREPAPHDQEMRELAATMSDLMKAVNGRRYGYGAASESLYLTNGDTDDWVYGEFGAIGFTIELPPPAKIGHFITDEDEIEPICRENRPALLAFINHFINRGN